MKGKGFTSMRTMRSLTLCRSLLNAGLVDRFRVVVLPSSPEAAGADLRRLSRCCPRHDWQRHVRRSYPTVRVRPTFSLGRRARTRSTSDGHQLAQRRSVDLSAILLTRGSMTTSRSQARITFWHWRRRPTNARFPLAGARPRGAVQGVQNAHAQQSLAGARDECRSARLAPVSEPTLT
jgi:hypothetical protein